MNSGLRILSLVAASLLFFACGQKIEPTCRLVELAEVEAGNGQRLAAYPGRTESRTSSSVSFLVMGSIERICVQEGDYVGKGQLLALLDRRDYNTQLSATQAEYDQVKAECERVIAMHEDHAVSDNDYDKARSGLRRITAKLEHHKAQLGDCELRAPYGAYVEKIHHHAGEVVAPGVPVVSLVSAGGIDIVINIPEVEYRRRQKVISYTATFNAFPGKQFSLKLKSVSPVANANQLYQVRLVLVDNAVELTSGMSVMVKINYKETEHQEVSADTLSAPNEVNIPMGAVWADDQQSFVYLYDSVSSTIVRTPVTLNRITAEGTAIVTEGLSIGQRVVASGVHHLHDGEQVRTQKASSSLNTGNLL